LNEILPYPALHPKIPHESPPTVPNKRGQRGIQYATTTRLLQLKDRYDRLAADPGSGAGLRVYARELVVEVTDELRARTRLSHLMRGVS